jgi:hypothetical protein
VLEAHDEWAATNRRCLPDKIMAQLAAVPVIDQEGDQSERLMA